MKLFLDIGAIMGKSELIKRLERLTKEWKDSTAWMLMAGSSTEMKEFLRGKAEASADCARDLESLINEVKD